MFIYFLLIGYILIVNLVLGQNNKRKKIACILTCIGLIFVQALRAYTVGNDLFVYRTTFNVICRRNLFDGIKYANSVSMEPGIAIVMKIVGTIFNSWQMFIAITAIFINTVVCVFVCRESEFPLLYFLLYIGLDLFVFSFSGLRQMYAIALTMIAFGFIKNKKYVRFIISVLLACLFHSSAIVFLVVMLFRNVRINSCWLIAITITMAMILVFAYPIAYLMVSKILPEYINYINGTNSFGLLGIFYAATFYMLYIMNNYKANNCHNSFLLFIVALAACCQLFGNVSTVTSRITFYFVPYVDLALTNSINTDGSIAKSSKKTIVCLYALFVLVAFFMQDLLHSYLAITPYKFFWQ